MKKIFYLILLILFSFFVSGYLIRMPEPLNPNEGLEVNSDTVFELILFEMFKNKILLTKPVLQDRKYVLYPKDKILQQTTAFPFPKKFDEIEYSNCNHKANFLKVMAQQTLPGAPCLYMVGSKLTSDGWVSHAWLGILSFDDGIIEVGSTGDNYFFIKRILL